tara:strand:+ start:116 stop:373 length:258 start_codon:yes stop_codon:yes gene_type:complete
LPSTIKFIFPKGNTINGITVDQVLAGIFNIQGNPSSIGWLLTGRNALVQTNGAAPAHPAQYLQTFAKLSVYRYQFTGNYAFVNTA